MDTPRKFESYLKEEYSEYYDKSISVDIRDLAKIRRTSLYVIPRDLEKKSKEEIKEIVTDYFEYQFCSFSRNRANGLYIYEDQESFDKKEDFEEFIKSREWIKNTAIFEGVISEFELMAEEEPCMYAPSPTNIFNNPTIFSDELMEVVGGYEDYTFKEFDIKSLEDVKDFFNGEVIKSAQLFYLRIFDEYIIGFLKFLREKYS